MNTGDVENRMQDDGGKQDEESADAEVHGVGVLGLRE